MPLPSLSAIKERKLVQWGLAYLGGAWLILQVAVALGGVYGWPMWLLRAVPVLLVVGFLAALVIAWYHGEKGRQRVGSVELGLLAALLGLAGLGVALIVPSDGSSDASLSVETANLDNLTTDQALDLAYDWGTSGNVEASTEVLDYLIERAESDSARMSFLALGASVLSRNDQPDDTVAWILRLMDIDPVGLTLSAHAGPEITQGYLEAMRQHYSSNAQPSNTRPSDVRDIAVLPQSAYMAGFPDSLATLRQEIGRFIPDLLTGELAQALRPTGTGVLERVDLEALQKGPLPIGTVSVGLPGSDWLWLDESLMPEPLTRASHYVLSYCTYLGEPFETGGVASFTCTARLLATESGVVRASAQSRGDIGDLSSQGGDLFEMIQELSAELATQIASPKM
ncbi:MAG: hypothetical protein Rubg2KO_35840 [Rubricoccaceae bacterium]